MSVNRRQHATTGVVVLALLLGSLWAGGMAAPAAGNAGQLASSASLPGIEPAALPDRVPALRPSAERPDSGSRLLPLGGLVVAALTAAASGVPARRRRSSLAPARSPVLSAPRGPRAPPFLQPA